MLVALFAIPILLDKLGTERFGILTIAWMIIGYFNLFDMGLGKAMTKLVADRLGAGHVFEIANVVWTALSLISVFSLVGALVVVKISPWLVSRVFNIPSSLQHETLNSFYLLAFTIPMVTITVGLRGVLEAFQRFYVLNLVRTSMGIYTFAGPLLVVCHSRSIFSVITVLAIGRAIALGSYMILCLKMVPLPRKNLPFRKNTIKELLTFGGWMTISNTIGPFIVYFDRFLIGSLISVTAIAYYCTPFEIINRMRIIPDAMMSVLFPAFSTVLVQHPSRTAVLFKRSVSYLFLAMYPPTLIAVTFAYQGLDIWLGPKFAQNSAFVLQWFAVGILISGLGKIAFTLVQSCGRPDLTTKVQFFEMPFYFALLWVSVTHYGIRGAAVCWTFRVAIDTALMFVFANTCLPFASNYTRRSIFLILLCLGFLVIGSLCTGLASKVAFTSVTLTAFIISIWFFVFVPEERVFFRSFFIACKTPHDIN